MLRSIKNYFSPIEFLENGEKNRASRVLYALWLNTWLVFALHFFGILFVYVQKLGSSILLFLIFLMQVSVRHFHRRGRIRLSSYILVFGLWAIYMLVVILHGSIQTTFVVMPVATTTMAVLLLGIRTGIIGATLTVLILLGMLVLETAGYTPPVVFPIPSISSFYTTITAITTIIAPLYQALRGLNQALTRARQSETQFRELWDATVEGLIIHDREKILEVNDSICNILGDTRENIVGKTFYDLTSGEIHELIRKRIASDDSEPTEIPISRRDGERIIEVFPKPIIYQGKAVRVTAIRDITKRKQAEKKLMEAYDTTLEGWAKALELHDKETEDHSRRVTELTVKLAQAMGVKGDDLIQIRRGAILHDIGKMAIPDEILRKRGPLTVSERKVIEQHPLRSYELLSPISFLEKALEIPYCHHEHWDGSGYPRGLKGDEIPLAARIFTVIDVWDAVQSDRPYNRAWPKEKAIQYLKDETGKYFDPKCVSVFLDLVKQGKI